MVYWHNIYRARHGAPPVTWNDTLAAYAANYSTFCSTDHSNSEFYGENLAYGGFSNPAYYVYLWYDEIGNYNYNDPVFGLNTGHFTQVIWADSIQIGCGWVVNGCQNTLGQDYPNYLACEYYPFGNVDGEFADQVLPLITNSSIPVPGMLSSFHQF
jgi:pathogenesis-related protein 1